MVTTQMIVIESPYAGQLIEHHTIEMLTCSRTLLLAIM